jgi:DNA recombination protein RmuC
MFFDAEKITDYIIIGLAVLLILLMVLLFFTTFRLIKQLKRELSKSREDNSRLKDALDDARRDIEESRRDVERSMQSQQSMRQELTQSLQLGLGTINKSLTDNTRQIDKKMEHLRGSVDLQLDKMRATVDEKLQQTLEERLSRSFSAVRESLDQVYRGLGEMQTLAGSVGDLKKVLSNVKNRGILGEIQLGAILEQILSTDQYLTNVSTVPGSSEKVEFAVRMPGAGDDSVLLPIDAKFPGDSYIQLMDAYEAADSAAIAAARKNLINVIRKEAKDIHDKYVEAPYTTDFAVMFLPFEGLYAEAVNLGLLETLQREQKVMIAGPSTMAALLNSLQMGFRTLAIQKNAGQVWKVLDAVKSEFDKFGAVLLNTQQRLNQANAELDKLVGTRTRAIQRKLSQVQSLEDPDADADQMVIKLSDSSWQAGIDRDGDLSG